MTWAAGQLNHYATLDRRLSEPAADGGTVENTIWYAVAQLWCGIKPTAGREANIADRATAISSMEVMLRQDKELQLTSHDRLRLEDGRILYFDEPPRDPDGRGFDWIASMSEELDNG